MKEQIYNIRKLLSILRTLNAFIKQEWVRVDYQEAIKEIEKELNKMEQENDNH